MKSSVLAATLAAVSLAGLFVPLTAVPHDGALPLGDGKISQAPQVGYLYACQTQFKVGGARHAGDWIQGDVWYPGEKPAVMGSVAWPGSAISVTLEGDRRVIRANNLPQHPTGVFPIRADDPAYRFDTNPNAIQPQQILLSLPADPVMAGVPACVPMGMIGFALDGVAIFNAVDAAGRDAVAHEVQDSCNGHPQREGQYHYHGPSPCMADAAGAAGKHSDLVGYALDGFGIYGMHGEDGRVLHDSDLDACHGHSHAVMWDGRMQVIYHYHFTPEYPYSVGCFRGAVDPALLDRRPEGAAQGHGMRPGVEERLTRAAASLGIPVERLRQALGPPPPDFARAAQQLGISEQALRDAMRKAREQDAGSP